LFYIYLRLPNLNHMKRNLLLFFTLLLSTCCMAQDFPYGNPSPQELDMKKYNKDTSAHAVVLQEFGEARIALDNSDDLRLYVYYHVKIKILDNKGFNKGNIELPLYTGDNGTFESIDDLKATTFYPDDNGNLQKADLDAKNTFTVKHDKHWSEIKFAMPAMRSGSIIEYSFKLTSPYFFENLKTWTFQQDIPVVYSEYLVHIPAYFNYKATLRGGLKLTKNKGEIEDDCVSIRGVKNACSKIAYAMADIPAFAEEDYMTSSKNFLAAIYFELEDFTSPYTGLKTRVTKDWKDIDQQLKINDDFGVQLKKKDLFKEPLKTVIVNKTGIDKAKVVYAYIQKTFKWNNYIGIYSNDGIRSAFNTHTGSIADINLSLVAALNEAGIPTEAVILSTRNHGSINMLYPGIGDFNYVIAKANVGDKSYLLDASDPLLPFGILPLTCLNDKGRVFSLDKPSYWIDLNTAITQRENDTYAFDLTLQDNGKITGSVTHYSLGYSAYENRKAIKKFNSINEYVENLDEKLPKLKILKSDITNVDSLDMPLSEKYEIEIDAYDNLNHDRLVFDPYFFNKTTNNPFKLVTRDYPVDWGMPSDSRCTVTMHLPAQYTVETPPKIAAFALPNNGGKFITAFDSDNTAFTFSYATQFTKSVYNPNEYPFLKEFYNKIIQTEHEEIIFKKKI